MAYRTACLNAIAYLEKFGYSGAQAYLLLGAAPIEGRVSGVVDIPNACCSLYLPTAIFDFDVRPRSLARYGPIAVAAPYRPETTSRARAYRAVAGAAAGSRPELQDPVVAVAGASPTVAVAGGEPQRAIRCGHNGPQSPVLSDKQRCRIGQ